MITFAKLTKYKINYFILFSLQMKGYMAGKAQLPGIYSNMRVISDESADGVAVCMAPILKQASAQFASAQSQIAALANSAPAPASSPAQITAPPASPVNPTVSNASGAIVPLASVPFIPALN